MQPEYAHTPIVRPDPFGTRHAWCAECREPYPCRAQQVHALHAAQELAAYFRRYGAQGYGHADAIAAAVAA